jgi:branched-chain amino acid transport system permease protein
MTRTILSLVIAVATPVVCLALGDYQGGLFAQFAMYGVATAALALSWGFTGILNLGHAVSFGVGAYVTAWCAVNCGAFGVLVGLILGAICAGLIAVAVGAIGLRGRVNLVTFALLTFVILFAASDVANDWTSVSGGYNGISGIPALNLGPSVSADVVSQRVILAVIAAGLMLLMAHVARGPFGALLSLIRDNPVRAASLGYDVPRVRIGVFTATGIVTALAGGLFATQVQFVSPADIGLVLATNFVVWAMIGSRTSVVGSFVAAVVMSFVSNQLSAALDNYWLLIVGGVFLVVVLLIPGGLASALERLVPARLLRDPAPRYEVQPPQPRPATGANLSIAGVTATFGRFTAVSDVSIEIASGSVHCLIGPNGAGKSSLLNALSGTHLPNAGQWSLGALDLSMLPPWKMANLGLSRKFQAPSIAPSLTVFQNMALASWGPTATALSLVRKRWYVEMSSASWTILRAGGLTEQLGAKAGSLSHGQKQLLELAMVFEGRPRAILLDEPTAGMTRGETDAVARLLREQAEQLNVPIVVVEHDMSLIRGAATTVTVLQAGRVLAEGSVKQIEANPAVIAAYLGGAHT